MSSTRRVSRRNVYYYAHLQRLKDAEALFEKQRWIGCIYLAGVAVECLLKYAVCIKEDAIHLEDVYPDLLTAKGHELDVLLERAGLTFSNADREIAQCFRRLQSWGVHIRYTSSDGYQQDASQFLNSARTVCKWIISKSYR
jgi:HEPN domain-containing protein